jgi:hypothetical protein
LNITLTQQISNLEKTQAKLITASTCLSWLAVSAVVIIFSLALINDLVKLFFFLRENDNIKRNKNSKAKESELYEFGITNESVFIKVTKKEIVIYNHSFFK